MDSDRGLVSRLREGDRAAFAQVYEAHHAKIYNFLARMTAHPEVAEELFQETWLKLALHAPRLAEDTDLGGWLYTVARNQYLSHRRSERVRPVFVDAPAAGLRARTETPSPHDWAAANETEARLERALSALAAPYREVLLLVVVEGLGQDQVARILGIGHDAVRQRLTRARAKLVAVLETCAGPPEASSEEVGDARH